MIARHHQGGHAFTIDLWTFPHPGVRRAELPLAALLARHLHRRSVTLARSVSGKPFIAGGGIHFSVAHAAGMSVVAVASRPVGVDVESLAEPPRAIDGVRRYLSPWEGAWVRRGAGDDRLQRTLACWTRLEARCKAEETGLRGPLRPGWRSVDFCVAGNWIGAVAARGTRLGLRFREWRG